MSRAGLSRRSSTRFFPASFHYNDVLSDDLNATSVTLVQHPQMPAERQTPLCVIFLYYYYLQLLCVLASDHLWRVSWCLGWVGLLGTCMQLLRRAHFQLTISYLLALHDAKGSHAQTHNLLYSELPIPISVPAMPLMMAQVDYHECLCLQPSYTCIALNLQRLHHRHMH